jgi:hypothetical protein
VSNVNRHMTLFYRIQISMNERDLEHCGRRVRRPVLFAPFRRDAESQAIRSYSGYALMSLGAPYFHLLTFLTEVMEHRESELSVNLVRRLILINGGTPLSISSIILLSASSLQQPTR